jgi:hypothetical protein
MAIVDPWVYDRIRTIDREDTAASVDPEPDQDSLDDDQLSRLGINTDSIPVDTTARTTTRITDIPVFTAGDGAFVTTNATGDVGWANPVLNVATNMGVNGNDLVTLNNSPDLRVEGEFRATNATIASLDVTGETYLMGRTHVQESLDVTGQLTYNSIRIEQHIDTRVLIETEQLRTRVMELEEQIDNQDDELLRLTARIGRLEENG